MGSKSDNAEHSTGRRQFLKSLFGLGGVIKGPPATAMPAQGAFVWADLKTGQVGFPTGTAMEPGLPGSLMKLVGAAAIREENLLPAKVTFECSGSIQLHRQTYTCQVAHGRLDFAQAIAQSCNVFFVQASESLAPPLFLAYARKFSLDRPAAGFPSGPFPDIAQGEPQRYVLGLAEELKPQMLQILQMSALIATRGRPPALYDAQEPGASDVAPRLDLSRATWDLLGEGMKMACRLGTARQIDPENKLRLAVKTGTAPHGKSFQSWVTGYFPWDAPRHAFCARAPSGTSQSAAVPLARRFLFAAEWP